MFYLSALLLDDALKLATPQSPLTNGVINETLRQFEVAHSVTFHKVV